MPFQIFKSQFYCLSLIKFLNSKNSTIVFFNIPQFDLFENTCNPLYSLGVKPEKNTKKYLLNISFQICIYICICFLFVFLRARILRTRIFMIDSYLSIFLFSLWALIVDFIYSFQAFSLYRHSIATQRFGRTILFSRFIGHFAVIFHLYGR